MANPHSHRSREVASARTIAAYLDEYIRIYRKEYERFTAAPPDGCGYPQLAISPYLSAPSLVVYIARDGYAIADYSNEPDYMWHVAGGPTLMIDTEPSSVPEQINAILQQRGLLGKDIGIYRIVPRQPLTPGVAEGVLQSNAKQIERRVNGTKILARSYSYDLAGLIR